MNANDSVIEGYYAQYVVADLFDTQFKYTQFDTDQCLYSLINYVVDLVNFHVLEVYVCDTIRLLVWHFCISWS